MHCWWNVCTAVGRYRYSKRDNSYYLQPVRGWMMVIRDDSSFIGGESCSAALFTSPGWSKNDINTSLQISVSWPEGSLLRKLTSLMTNADTTLNKNY